MNVTPKIKRLEVIKLFKEGNSLRKIAKAVGITTHTTIRILKKHDFKELKCDYCKVREVSRWAEYFRRTRRTKHKFCSHYCYGMFYRKLRENDTCKRCGTKRKEIFCGLMVRGYCQKCYGLLREFGFKEELADIHDYNQELKKEARNEKHAGT